MTSCYPACERRDRYGLSVADEVALGDTGRAIRDDVAARLHRDELVAGRGKEERIGRVVGEFRLSLAVTDFVRSGAAARHT